MRLTEAHYLFLRAVAIHAPTYRRGLPPADKGQKKARQECIRWRLAKYGRDGWYLLSAGRAALSGEKQ